MFKSVLIQTLRGIDKEINTFSKPYCDISQQNSLSDFHMSFNRLIQRKYINLPLFTDCT